MATDAAGGEMIPAAFHHDDLPAGFQCATEVGKMGQFLAPECNLPLYFRPRKCLSSFAYSIPPRDAPAHIGQILASGCCGGCFRIWFDEPAWVFRIGDALSNLKVDLTGIAYGDHGFFCTAEAFHRVGGYPAVPLLEDADLYRALGRLGGVRQAPAYIFTSARRYHAHGPWRNTLIYLLLSTPYMLGCQRDVITRWHERLLPPDAAKPRRAISRKWISV